MRKIRVLVVDDSVVIRKLVTDALAGDPALEIVGTAATGKIALTKIPALQPDLVTLDIEMPEMDGLATLAELRRQHPKLPVIMFSTLTARGASQTFDALSLGANDYVTKPANVGCVVEGIQRVRETLVPKIKALCPGLAWVEPRPAPPVRPPRVAPPRTAEPIDLIAVGVSTGGPCALAELLGRLPGDLPVPVVIVQHMPPVFTRHLATRLDAKCALPVREASGGEPLMAGNVWIAPGDLHLVVAREAAAYVLRTQSGPPENSCRPAVDVLFRSVAEVYGSRALGVILTGMGQDGLRGAEQLHAAGGRILAQDEASSVVWGMPGAAVKAGLAEKVLPLDTLAAELVAEATRGRTPVASGSGGLPHPE